MERQLTEASIHSLYQGKYLLAVERMTRLENLIILLEADAAQMEQKLIVCEKVLADLKVSPYHPTMID